MLGLLVGFPLSIQAQDTLKVVQMLPSEAVPDANDSTTVAVPASKSEQQLRIRKTKPEISIQKVLAKSYSFKLDSIIFRHRNQHSSYSHTLKNPYYFALMGGTTFYSSSLKNNICFTTLNTSRSHLSSGLNSSFHIYDIVNAIDAELVQVYAQMPWYVRYKEEKEGTLNVDQEIRESIKPETTFTEHFTEELGTEEFDLLNGQDLGIIVRKPNFWNFKTNFSFQFTQNYVTDNWYKGGESHNALLASAVIDANYDNKQRLTFDNRLEMKLGFQTSHDDLQHKFKTNSDLLRLTNKLGLNAIQDWYYTLMVQSWTQFYKGYKPNDPKVYSDFMAPFVSLVSLGMDYKKHSKNNRFNITATISPIALKFQYVKRPELVTSFGHDEGDKVKWEYGSNITVSYNWNIWKNISWGGRFYFFSDYSKSQIEWENTFNFTINKYLSTRLFLYPRFDDAVARKDGQSYFQFNELLSLGLNFDF